MANPRVEMKEGSQENLKYEMMNIPIFPYNIWDHCLSDHFEISVVILNHQRKKWLEDCLFSILRQETNLKFEIIIVDDASTDGVEDMLLKKYNDVFRSKRMKYIKICTRLGWRKPLLMGVDAADAKLVLITQSDIIHPHKDGIAKLHKHLGGNTFGVFAPCKFIHRHFDVADDNIMEELTKISHDPKETWHAKDEGEPWPYYALFRREDAQTMLSVNEPYYDRSISQYFKYKIFKDRNRSKLHFMKPEEVVAVHVAHPPAITSNEGNAYWWSESIYSP